MAQSLTCSCCSRRVFLGVTLMSLFSGLGVLGETVHVVKKGETLIGLSRKYDVTLRELAAANDLSTTTKIKIGQRIVIPGAAGDKPQVDAKLKASLDSTSVKRGRWKNIVVHHSATAEGTLKGMDEYHRNNRHMENGLAYHFVIGNGRGMGDGLIAAGNRWKKQLAGGHLASEALNEISLGVCLVGNFEKTEPTKAQMKALAALTNYLMRRCGLSMSAVKTHQQINTVYTICPGKKFSPGALRGLLAA